MYTKLKVETGSNANSETNLRFRLTFTENNLRYLLGETERDEVLIAETRQEIETIKTLLSFTNWNGDSKENGVGVD